MKTNPCFFNGVHVGKWRDKRNVSYISTEYTNSTGIVKNKRVIETAKPTVIIEYNYISGVDRQDQMLLHYSYNRKTIRWYKKIFIQVLQMSLINAYYFHKIHFIQNMRLYDFRLEVVRDLLCLQSVPNVARALIAIRTIHRKVEDQKATKKHKKDQQKGMQILKIKQKV